MRLESSADHLGLVDLIARWHFAEWGHLDPSGTLEPVSSTPNWGGAWWERMRMRGDQWRF
jgi:hypothetical protein